MYSTAVLHLTDFTWCFYFWVGEKQTVMSHSVLLLITNKQSGIDIEYRIYVNQCLVMFDSNSNDWLTSFSLSLPAFYHMTTAHPMCIPCRFFCAACLDWTGISVDQDAQDQHLTVGGPNPCVMHEGVNWQLQLHLKYITVTLVGQMQHDISSFTIDVAEVHTGLW